MFKKLRNNFLAVSSATIAALIICSFGLNYLMVYQGLRSSTDRKLENEIKMAERRISHETPPEKDAPDISGAAREASPYPEKRGEHESPDAPEGRKEPRGAEAPEDLNERLDFGRNQEFSPTFSVITDMEGNVKEVTMAFSMTEDFYSERAAELLSSGRDGGKLREVNSDGSVSNWQYAIKRLDEGCVIAFTEISYEINILRMFALRLLLIAAAAIIVTVFISLFFANRSIKPIEEAYNKQKQFIADASHELKTPLAAINTNIDVLLSRDGADDEDRKWLMYIKDETGRMNKLTNSLLYLARAGHDASTRVFGSVSWTEIVKNILLVMEARVFEQNIRLDSQIEDGVNVAADSEQLKRLVMILLDNAVKYTPSGGSIEVSLKKKSADAHLTVRNTGTGIDEADLPHIFDRFYRSDKARTYTEDSGYGLGLAIAKAAAESFRGTISVESDSESYALFTVKLPLIKS